MVSRWFVLVYIPQMKKPIRKPGKNPHFCLLINKSAAAYDEKLIAGYLSLLRSRGHYYTTVEPVSAAEMARAAEVAAGLRKSHGFYSPAVSRRGKVTALIACGGDGTVNLVARAASKAKLPVGVLPMGGQNNIARSLFGDDFKDRAIKQMASGKTRRIDMGEVGNQQFLGSVAFGLPIQLNARLKEFKAPRFGMGWSRIVTAAMDETKIVNLDIKVDSFRFEVSPSMLIVSLVSSVIGLPLNNAADLSDGKAEVILDFNSTAAKIGSYFKEVAKKKYLYGSDVRLFRGQSVTVRPVKGANMYLDGELISLPVNVVEITIGREKVEVFA